MAVQVLISTVSTRHLGALGARSQSALETGVSRPVPRLLPVSVPHCKSAEVMDSSPWPGLCVASPAPHHSTWSFPRPTVICLESADPVQTSSQAGKRCSSWLPFLFEAQPIILSGPSWLLPLRQLSKSFYPTWEAHVCSFTAWPDPTLGWRETLRNLYSGCKNTALTSKRGENRC